MEDNKIYTIYLRDNLSPKIKEADDAVKALEQTLKDVNEVASIFGDTIMHVQRQLQTLPEATKDSFISSWNEVMDLANNIFELTNKVSEITKGFKASQVAQAYGITQAKAAEAIASGELTAAEIAEAGITSELTAAQWALNVAVDAFPGMIIVTAISVLAAWAFSASSNLKEVKDNYEDLHSLEKETGDIEKKASDELANRLAPMQTELELVRDYQKIADDTTKTETQRNDALKGAKEHWKNIKELGGDFTNNLSDTRIDIQKATGDMKDFGDAVQAAALKMAATESIAGNMKDLINKEFQNKQNEQKAWDIFNNKSLSSSEKQDQLNSIFGKANVEKYLSTSVDTYHANPDPGPGFWLKEYSVIQDVYKYTDGVYKLVASLNKQSSDVTNDANKGMFEIINNITSHGKDVSPKTSIKSTKPETFHENNSATNSGQNNIVTDDGTKATASKNVSIKIDIKELVHELKIQTTNLTEATGKIKDMVTQALISAVNDTAIDME